MATLFEWDENKRLRNLRDHEVDLIDMVALFDGRPVFTYYSSRSGEDRWGTVGLLRGKFYLVVWTMRGGRRRIISAYRADDWEIREYRALYG